MLTSVKLLHVTGPRPANAKAWELARCRFVEVLAEVPTAAGERLRLVREDVTLQRDRPPTAHKWAEMQQHVDLLRLWMEGFEAAQALPRNPNVPEVPDLAALEEVVQGLYKVARAAQTEENSPLRPWHPMAESHYDLATAALETAGVQLRLATYHRMRGW